MRILLAAFEPFGKHAINASEVVAARVVEEAREGGEVNTVVLPVVRFEAARALVDAFEATNPDAVVMLGIADTRGAVTPERIALNVDDYRIPDNAGNAPVDEVIVDGGPLAYASTLPVRAIVSALAEAEIQASISNTAGTYLCNHVFYALMHYLAVTRSRALGGFVHIPQLTEAADEGPSLPLDTLVRAVGIVLDVVAYEVD
jgi:pyroglutamyl-peptidase